MYVRLAAHLQGRVGGLCGNFDGDTENDFTTRQGIVESTPELFGNSWKVSPSCPDVANQDLRDPCGVSSDTCTFTHSHFQLDLNLDLFIYCDTNKVAVAFALSFSYSVKQNHSNSVLFS